MHQKIYKKEKAVSKLIILVILNLFLDLNTLYAIPRSWFLSESGSRFHRFFDFWDDQPKLLKLL